MQEREDQLRARRAAQVNDIQLTRALVTIESWEDTGFDLFSAPRDEYGMRVLETNTSDLTRRVAWERRRRLAQREGAEAQLRDQDLSEQPEDESSDSGYDPNNLRCPDRVPGCFCGDESEECAAARIIQNAWRIHLHLRLSNLQGDMLVPLHGSTAASSTEHDREPTSMMDLSALGARWSTGRQGTAGHRRKLDEPCCRVCGCSDDCATTERPEHPTRRGSRVSMPPQAALVPDDSRRGRREPAWQYTSSPSEPMLQSAPCRTCLRRTVGSLPSMPQR